MTLFGSNSKRPFIYFIDDEPDILDVFVSCFSELFELQTFLSPEEAIAAITTPGARQPDAIVTDFRMPKMTGLEMLSQMRERGVETRAILLSGNLDKEIVIRAANKGVFKILEKPFDSQEIERAIEDLLVERNADLVRSDIRAQMFKLKETYSTIRLLMTARVPEFDDILHELMVDTRPSAKNETFESMLEDLEFKLERLLESEESLVHMRRRAA